jgi:transcriptional regulator with XRE-family HTH domain
MEIPDFPCLGVYGLIYYFMVDSAEVMKRARVAFEKSTLTLEELGQRMGIDSKTARMSAWQFLNKTSDPRLSMLLKFCAAVEMSIEELVSEKKKSRSK